METSDTQRALQIIDDAHGLSPSELDAYLDHVCGSDTPLRREVLSILEFSDEKTVFPAVEHEGSVPDIPGASTLETRYILGEEIARGGIGVIHRAFDRTVGRDVAVKVLRGEAERNPDVVHRFLQEAQIGGQLQHPGLPPVYDIGRLSDGGPFIAMKLVKGATLQRLLAQRQDAAENKAKFLSIFQQVCQTIAFAHDRGVIHRDLKPANVMVGEFGEVQVMDWGIAKVVDHEHQPDTCSVDVVPAKDSQSGPESRDRYATENDITADVDTDHGALHTRIGQVLGTPSYMAPEQAIGRAGKATDVFALGGILCEILTGAPPYQAVSSTVRLDQAIRGEIQEAHQRLRESGAERELVQLAIECLAPVVDERPPDANHVERRITAYSDSVQQRIQEAEVAAARAEAQAKEEGRRRQRTLRTVVGFAIVLVIAALAVAVVRNSYHQRSLRQRARALVDSIKVAEVTDVPVLVEQLNDYRQWARPILDEVIRKHDDDSKEMLHARLAMIRVDPKGDGQQHLDHLYDRLLIAKPQTVLVMRALLEPYKEQLSQRLWKTALNPSHSDVRLPAASLLAVYAPEDVRWKRLSGRVASDLLADSRVVDEWIEQLQPVGHLLVDPLTQVLNDRDEDLDGMRPLAALALAEYLSQDAEALLERVLVAEQNGEFEPLIEKLRGHGERAHPALLTEIRRPLPDDAAARDRSCKRQALAAVALLHLDHPEPVWPLLQHTPDPTLRSYLIRSLQRLGDRYQAMTERLDDEQDVSIRRALILALGGRDRSKVSQSDKQRLLLKLRHLHQTDPDPGIHGASEWALRRWGEPINLQPTLKPPRDDELADRDASRGSTRRWYVNSEGQTMVIVSGPSKFGPTQNITPADAIDHTFAIAAHPVTVEQFRRFRVTHQVQLESAPQKDCPVHWVSWFYATAYCNWLSEQEGIPQEQWCYEPNPDGRYDEGMKIAADYQQRLGYRLPMEVEWQYACRARSYTNYSFGDPMGMLTDYGWYGANSQGLAHPVGRLLPNDFGLFDMHGNLHEWCMNVGTEEDPPTMRHNHKRALAGGAYNSLACRSKDRYPEFVDRIGTNIGFRVARTHR